MAESELKYIELMNCINKAMRPKLYPVTVHDTDSDYELVIPGWGFELYISIQVI